MVDTFRDWIPDGEDPGAQGNVFRDFVPPVKPEVKQEIKEEMTTPIETNGLKCETCGFVAKSELGLGSHKRKHEVK